MKKKSLIRLLSIVMTFMILVPYITADAAVIPKIKFTKSPLKEYKANEKITLQVSCPNYKGKVEYRAVVYDTVKKTSVDVWNVSNGFPGKFNTKLRQAGNKNFTITLPQLQPGIYKVYVYVRRVGMSLKSLALKSASCDSYVTSTVITVKPAEIVLNKKGIEYSPAKKNIAANVNGSIKVTAEGVKLQNVRITGNLYLSGNNVQISNVNINGTVAVDPGKDGNATLENVTAKEIKVLSGGENSIHLNSVKSEKLTIETQSKVRVVSEGETKITNTYVKSSVLLDTNKGSFGAVEVNSSKKENISLELNGKFENKILVKSGAEIKVREGAQVSNIEVAVENKEETVKVEGKVNSLVVSREAKVKLAQNAEVGEIKAEAKLEVEAEKGAKVDKIEGSRSKDVKVTGEGAKDVGKQGDSGNGNGNTASTGNNTGNTGNNGGSSAGGGSTGGGSTGGSSTGGGSTGGGSTGGGSTGGGSTGGGSVPYYSVTGVKIDKIAAVVKLGDTVELVAEISPSYATNKSLTWTSDDTNVATVSNGIVTAKSEGTAVITVRSNDGNKTAKFKIKVTRSDLKIKLKKNVGNNGVKVEITSSNNKDVITVTIKDKNGNLKYIDQLELNNGKGEFTTPLDSGEYTINIKGLESDLISLDFDI